MKRTRTVVFARCLIVLAMVLFLAAIVSQGVISNIYITSSLYLLAIISFSISMALAFIAASKDKEHLKNVELSKKDERLQNITMRSKAKAFDVITYILPLITAYQNGRHDCIAHFRRVNAIYTCFTSLLLYQVFKRKVNFLISICFLFESTLVQLCAGREAKENKYLFSL